jgi:hypothetical protein
MKYSSPITQVWLDLAAHEKLWAWTRMAKGEVSMLGLVEDGDGGPVITDVFLMRQTCTAASTDMDQADIARLLFDLGAAGIEGQLRAWIHSHAEMAVFWSSTDDKCIEGLGGDPYIVSLVVNHKGDVKARIDVFKPIRFVIDDVPVKLRVPDLGLEEPCRAEFMAKVTEVHSFSTLGMGLPGSVLTGTPGNDLFGARQRRPFAMMDIDEMEAAVYRGEMSVDEYMRAMDGDAFIDPFVDTGSETGEVANGRHA